MSIFPVFLKLAGRRVLVVGGGPVAAGKLRALLDAEADVTVVAPDVVDAILQAAVRVERRRRLRRATSTVSGTSWPRRRRR